MCPARASCRAGRLAGPAHIERCALGRQPHHRRHRRAARSFISLHRVPHLPAWLRRLAAVSAAASAQSRVRRRVGAGGGQGRIANAASASRPSVGRPRWSLRWRRGRILSRRSSSRRRSSNSSSSRQGAAQGRASGAGAAGRRAHVCGAGAGGTGGPGAVGRVDGSPPLLGPKPAHLRRSRRSRPARRAQLAVAGRARRHPAGPRAGDRLRCGGSCGGRGHGARHARAERRRRRRPRGTPQWRGGALAAR